MGFRIGRIFRGIKSAIGGGLKGLMKGGLGSLLGKVTGGGLIGGLVSKFGGKFLQKAMGFLGKLGPLAMMAGGPLGMVAGLLSKTGALGGIANLAKNLLGKLGGAGAVPAPGLGNLTEMFAQRQAQLLQSLIPGLR
jgi:hypothetical protein